MKDTHGVRNRGRLACGGGTADKPRAGRLRWWNSRQTVGGSPAVVEQPTNRGRAACGGGTADKPWVARPRWWNSRQTAGGPPAVVEQPTNRRRAARGYGPREYLPCRGNIGRIGPIEPM